MGRLLKTAEQWSEDERRAWRRYCLDGEACPLCLHGPSSHVCEFGQPHFYEKATEEDVRDRTVPLYRYDLPQGGSTLVRRVVAAPDTAIVTALCIYCAEGKRIEEELCFQATLATGEVRGIDTIAKGDTT